MKVLLFLIYMHILKQRGTKSNTQFFLRIQTECDLNTTSYLTRFLLQTAQLISHIFLVPMQINVNVFFLRIPRVEWAGN